MRLVDRYIAHRFAYTLSVCLAAFVAVFIVVDLVDHLDEFIDQKTPLGQMGMYYVYFVPYIMVLTLPIGMLLSTLFVVGAMATDNELAALKGAGLSIYRLAWPILRMSILISILAMFLADVIATPATRKRTRIAARRPTQTSKITDPAGFVVFASRYNQVKKTASRVMIQQLSGTATVKRIDAKSLAWTGDGWIARNADVRTFRMTSEVRQVRDSIAVALSLLPGDFATPPHKPDEMEFLELWEYIARRGRAGEDASKWLVDLHLKISIPLANLVVVLLGLPVAARSWRSGKAADIGWALLIAFVYFLLLRTGQAMAHAGDVSPFVGGWMANIIFASAGVGLLAKTPQ